MTTPTHSVGDSPLPAYDRGSPGSVFDSPAASRHHSHPFLGNGPGDGSYSAGGYTPGQGSGPVDTTHSAQYAPGRGSGLVDSSHSSGYTPGQVDHQHSALPGVQVEELKTVTKTVTHSHDGHQDEYKISESTSRHMRSFGEASDTALLSQVPALDAVPHVAGSGSLDNVISSLDGLSLSPATSSNNGAPTESLRSRQRPPSPNHLSNVESPSLGSVARSPTSPTSPGIISVPMLNIPSPTSSSSGTSSPSTLEAHSSGSPTKVSSSIAHDDIIGDSPSAVTSQGSSRKSVVTALHNGYTPTDELPKFDSSLQPELGSKMRLSSPVTSSLQQVSDLETSSSEEELDSPNLGRSPLSVVNGNNTPGHEASSVGHNALETKVDDATLV